MSFLNRIGGIFGQRKSEPVPSELCSTVAVPMRADSQVWVGEDQAIGVTTAWACASLIARTIAMLPCHVLVPRGDQPGDGNERMPQHSVQRLLAVEANHDMTGFVFRERMLLAALFHGNAFAEIERDQAGRPFALWPIHPGRVTAERDEDDRLVFGADNGMASRAYIPAADMLHLAGPAIDGPLGLSMITYHRQTLGLSVAQQRYQSSFIANSGAVSGILKIKNKVSPDGMARQRAEVENLYKGPRNAGRIAVTDGDSEWQSVGLSFLDAQFLEQRRFGVEETCRIFGVPPQKVGDQTKSTFANLESAQLQFLVDAVLPWTTRLEAEINRKMFRQTAVRQPFAKFNVAAVARANIDARFRAYAVGRAWGIFSANDCRALEDLDGIGAEGDIYLTPTNMQSAGDPPPNDDGMSDEDRQRAALLRRVV